MKSKVFVLGSVVVLGLLSGCRTGPRFDGPVRAVWVVRTDYGNPEDVKQVMANCADAGFNNVIFQVRGNGTVYYPSKIEPWSEEYDYQSPGFDPLAVACREAHARNLKIHAWVNVMPAWKGETPPKCPDQLYNKHPEWFWYDQHGQRQPLNSFYVSLNPCLPEVRTYLVEVFRELLANYPLDGLHMDYIRFPNEPPAIPRGSDIDYPRDKRTLELYRRDSWLWPNPDDNKANWDRWRTRQVTKLVAQIRDMIRETRPQAVYSASVGSSRKQSLDHFRDELHWVRWGLIDAAFPMNYKPDVQKFDQGLEMWMPYRGQVDVVPGLWFDGKLPTEQGISVVRQQIASAVDKTGNFCLFSYTSLFDPPAGRQDQRAQPADSARPRGRSTGQRELRRQQLLPYIRALGHPSDAGKVAILDCSSDPISR